MRAIFYRLVGICLFIMLLLNSVATHAEAAPKTDTAQSETSLYTTNAVWIMNAAWTGFPSDKKNVLTDHLSDVVNNLQDSDITYAFVFVGYWNPSDNTIDYTMTDSGIATVISALHSINCKVLAWAEDNGKIDVTPENRSKLYSEITLCMSKGFDGYNDDIESYVGTLQNWIGYENSATVVLHNLGKLMTADVGYDWQQDINPYLHMDFIISMFYSDRSKCEDPQGRLYWQENFGEYKGNANPPASPLILGIMNYPGNLHPLTWQLNWIDNELSSGDGHTQLFGFSVWLYEYMTQNDWITWKHWIASPHPLPTPTSTPEPHRITHLLSWHSEIICLVASVIGIVAIIATAVKIRRKL